MPTWRDPLTLPCPLAPRGASRGQSQEAEDCPPDWKLEQADAETRAFFGPKPSVTFRNTVWTFIVAAAAIGVARLLLVTLH